MFAQNGHNVVLFLLEDLQTYDTKDIKFPIVPLINIKNKYKIFGKLGYKIYARILKDNMKQYGAFDRVISNLPRADRTVKELNHPNKYFVIHTSYKKELEKFTKRKSTKKLKLYKYLYNNENIITITDAMQDDFKDFKISTKSMQTIYNPFDFDSIRSKGDEDIEFDFDYIISPSAFRKEKRYDILLDALKLLEDKSIKLLILAKENDNLNDMIKQRGLSSRVIIAGFKQNPYKYINHAKLLVLSSDREGLPTVVIAYSRSIRKSSRFLFGRFCEVKNLD
jgi:glycosyltransferase involved in cell wall biosynthesis